MPIFSIRTAAIGLSLLMLSYFFAGYGLAAQLTVNTLDDIVATDGQCALREAVEAANTDADFSDCAGTGAYGTDEILFSVAGVIGISPQLDITDSLSISGGSQIELTGNDQNRILDASGEGLELILSGLELRNGFDQASTGGGCIRLFGAGVLLEINDSTLRFCRVINTGVSGSLGGAIVLGRSPAVEPRSSSDGVTGGPGTSRLIIARTAFLNNQAESDLNSAAGGAIFAGPDPMEIRIEDSRFLANFAQSFDPSDQFAVTGGGIWVANGTSVFINRTEWSFNGAISTGGNSSGGGVFIGALTGPGLIQNSTFSENQTFSAGTGAETRGGAIFAVIDEPQILSLNNNTIVRNRARFNGALAFSGGIELNGAGNLANTILANNVTVNLSDPDNPVPSDCLPDSLLQSLGYNLIKTNCGLAPVTGDQFGVDPLLDDLADNGGAIEGMLSHLPLPGSPVIDSANPDPVQPFQPVGDARVCQPVDQRVLLRPFDSGGGAVCDIGAIELQGRPIGPAVAVPGLNRWGALLLAMMLFLTLIQCAKTNSIRL